MRAAQHRSKREDAARRIVLEHLGHHARVERLVPRFVAGNHAADPGEVRVTVPGGDPPDVAVRQARGALLKRGVHEEAVGIGPGLRIEAVGHEAVDGPFHGAHVHAAGETEIGVQQIAVAIFFGGPATKPARPWSRAGALVVLDQPVERNRVTGERLFGDHVAHQDDQQLVGDGLGCDSEPSISSRQLSISRSGR